MVYLYIFLIIIIYFFIYLFFTPLVVVTLPAMSGALILQRLGGPFNKTRDHWDQWSRVVLKGPPGCCDELVCFSIIFLTVCWQSLQVILSKHLLMVQESFETKVADSCWGTNTCQGVMNTYQYVLVRIQQWIIFNQAFSIYTWGLFSAASKKLLDPREIGWMVLWPANTLSCHSLTCLGTNQC